MKATDDARGELRMCLDEEIPAEGADTDTGFTNTQIDSALQQSTSVYRAAQKLWLVKAARLQKLAKEAKKYALGSGESEEYVTIAEQSAYALKMAAEYGKLAGVGTSALLSIAKPEVL
jgi:hypothetical protein